MKENDVSMVSSVIIKSGMRIKDLHIYVQVKSVKMCKQV